MVRGGGRGAAFGDRRHGVPGVGNQGGDAAQVLPAHTKTERIDARVLARMPMVDDGLHELVLPDAGDLALKRLVVLRNKLVGQTVKVADRVRSTLHWAAPGLLSGRESVTDGFVAVLARWPDLRRRWADRGAWPLPRKDPRRGR